MEKNERIVIRIAEKKKKKYTTKLKKLKSNITDNLEEHIDNFLKEESK